MSWPYWGALSGVLALGAVAAPLPVPPELDSIEDKLPQTPQLLQQQSHETGYLEVAVMMKWLPGEGWTARVSPANKPTATALAMPIHQVSKYLEGYVDALDATREARRPTIILESPDD